MRRVVVTAVLVLCGACGDGHPDRWDYCDDPGDARLDTLEFVRPVGYAEEPVEDGFLPVADASSVPTTFGGQGFEMIDVHLRMTGSVPGCVAQTTTLSTLADVALLSESSARVAFKQRDDSYRTWTIWLVLDDEIPRGEVIMLRGRVGDMAVERRITIEPRT